MAKAKSVKAVSAGRIGENVRSDCHVQLTILNKGGISIDLRSKVESMYGNSIRSLIKEVLEMLGILNATVAIEDRGAVPFVMAARLEAAAKRALPELKESFLPKTKTVLKKNAIDRLRRTRLYLPGNEPHYFLNAGLHKPDCVILDLEDSVAPAEKDTARILVRNALTSVIFGNAERMVRINQFPLGIKDLQAVIPYNVETVLIPKCESAAHVREVEEEIKKICAQHNIRRTVFLLPIIESALGVERGFEIATASTSTCALAIGLEDYTADIGVERTKEGKESLFARSAVINAAKAAGIQALDSVFSDVNDDTGLKHSVLEAKGIGFEGKGCIHPRQIKIIHDAFSPTSSEVEYAQRVIAASNEAQKSGSGVVALGSKMIDPPVVKRANRILSLAKLQSGEQKDYVK
ncbi:MAG: HpcH/HpaI aldolase/citrate lyase family protein [Ignavibacteriales bacterium]|nr:HpcH/HpaI aldolase/citrate lyase family protein [Ignavibacteriales bacterium]